MNSEWPPTKLGDVLHLNERREPVELDKRYRLLGVRLDSNGAFLREVKFGRETSAQALSRVATGDFIYSRLFAWRGAFGVIDAELDGAYVSGEFPTFTPVNGKLDVNYLKYWFRLPSVLRRVEADCTGSTPLTRNRYKEHFFLSLHIPLPPLVEQQRIVARIEALAGKIEAARRLRREAAEEARSILNAQLLIVFEDIAADELLQLASPGLAEVVAGQHIQAADYNADGIGDPYITGPADFGDEQPIIRRWTSKAKVKSIPGDVLVTVKGAGVGKLNLANDFPVVIGRQIMAVRPNPTRLLTRYLFYSLAHQLGYLRSQITATTVPGVKKEDIESMLVSCPPLEKQRSVVEHLDHLTQRVQSLRLLQSFSQRELDALLPALLDRAFRGEL